MKPIDTLRTRATELTNLNNILALLQWDQEVMMPPAASPERAEQFGVLSGLQLSGLQSIQLPVVKGRPAAGRKFSGE